MIPLKWVESAQLNPSFA